VRGSQQSLGHCRIGRARDFGRLSAGLHRPYRLLDN
jgi:hypothetical protein